MQGRLTRTLGVAVIMALAACAPLPPPVEPAAPSPGVLVDVPAVPRVFNVRAAPTPANGAVTTSTVHEGANLVSRVMRLAPGSEIGEHHHPVHDETFFVHRGGLLVVLNGEEHRLGAGDVVHIPAGTVISGRNTAQDEAIVVVVFSTTGRPGSLTVPGRPHH